MIAAEYKSQRPQSSKKNLQFQQGFCSQTEIYSIQFNNPLFEFTAALRSCSLSTYFQSAARVIFLTYKIMKFLSCLRSSVKPQNKSKLLSIALKALHNPGPAYFCSRTSSCHPAAYATATVKYGLTSERSLPLPPSFCTCCIARADQQTRSNGWMITCFCEREG